MKKKFLATLVIGLLMLEIAGVASAALITVDPNNFSPGTDISNSTEGITLSAFSTETIPNPYFKLADSKMIVRSIGNENVFGNTGKNDNDMWYNAGHQFRVDFTSPTSFASIMVKRHDESDKAIATFYDDKSTVLHSTHMDWNEWYSLLYKSSNFDISYMIVTSVRPTDSFYIGKLTFETPPPPPPNQPLPSVPVPTAILLLGSGLIGLTGARRKLKK